MRRGFDFEQFLADVRGDSFGADSMPEGFTAPVLLALDVFGQCRTTGSS